jgi:hypothetical protein
VTCGEWLGASDAREGYQTHLHRVEHPEFLPPLLVARDLARIRRTLGGATLDFAYADLVQDSAAAVADFALRSAAVYARWLGDARPGVHMLVAYSPRQTGLSYAVPGLLTLGAGAPHPLWETAHEVSHLWWGWSTQMPRWLAESLAEYAALRALEQTVGAGFVALMLREHRANVRDAGPMPPLEDTPGDAPNYWVNWYSRGALFFHALEARFGRDALDAMLRELYTDSGRARVTAAGFEARLRERFGDAVAPLIAAWLRSGDPRVLDDPAAGG